MDNETIKHLAECLPYELQSTLLAIRDDGLVKENAPEEYQHYFYLLKLLHYTDENGAMTVLGAEVSNYCSC